MSAPSITVLLVEDTPTHLLVVKHYLTEYSRRVPSGTHFQVETAESLSEALAHLDNGGIDAVVLDLMLPDSGGMDTLQAVLARAPDAAVVVLTGVDDEALGVQCLREGAQDYLVKGDLAFELVTRSVRYAVERKRAEVQLLKERAARAAAEAALRAARLEERQQRGRRRQELRSLERLSAPAPAAVTASAFGIEPLSILVPAVFRELVGRYGVLLELAVEQRVYRVTHPVSDNLRAMAEELGSLNAGPRDVMELHTATLKGKLA